MNIILRMSINTIHECLHAATTPTSVIVSPTVTHSPVMMGGVNVVAIAIPIVLVLLVVVGVIVGTVAVCVLVYINQSKSLQHFGQWPELFVLISCCLYYNRFYTALYSMEKVNP